MVTEKQEKHSADREDQQLEADIAGQVLRALGQPRDLHRVQVRRLWEGHFRVNVFVRAGDASARVAHSFFLVADREGTIIASTPKITSEY
jgi:hypothetical protein